MKKAYFWIEDVFRGLLTFTNQLSYKGKAQPMECVYLIRDNETGLHKIGMSTNWERRARQLQVGVTTTKVRVVACKNAEKWERVLHAMFKHKRIPQSEWFRITAEEAIPKMEWLAVKTDQRIVIGNWKQAQDGHYYRRRKSGSGNWYTEQKTSSEIQQQVSRELELIISRSEKEKLQKARSEPGYWPTREDRAKVEWAEKDPTYNPVSGWMVLIIISVILSVLFQQPAFLLIAVAAILFGLRK